MTEPKTIAEAIEKVHGKTPRPQPTGLAEALNVVRGSCAKPPEPTKKLTPVSTQEDGEPLPGLRSWLKDRRHGR